MVYYKVAVEAKPRLTGGSNASLRVHPLPGQGFDSSMNVECGRVARREATNGNVIILWAKETNREDGPPFLYSYFGWSHTKIKKAEAVEMIKKGLLGRGKSYPKVITKA